MAVIWTIVGVAAFLALVAVAWWIRRSDADEYQEGPDTMTDDERRGAQIGIGLAGGSGIGR